MFIPCVYPETCGYQKEALDPALVWVTIAVVKHMTKGKEARTGRTQLGRDLQRSRWVLLVSSLAQLS